MTISEMLEIIKNQFKEDQKVIEELQNKIDKAIEYIKVGACYDEEDKYFCDYLSSFELIELLEILEDKDE